MRHHQKRRSGAQKQGASATIRVGILLYPHVEVLDFCGPYEVLSVARLSEERRRKEPSPFQVLFVAEATGLIEAAGGLRVMPDVTTDQCPPLHVLIVPGGWGSRRQLKNRRLVGWIARRARDVELLASVCTGALLLGQAGVLDGRHATTHWAALDLLRQSFPGIRVEDQLRVVEDGRVLTSAGISAGIDMALRIVERYHGSAVATATARYMEYPFRADEQSPPPARTVLAHRP